MRLSQHDIDRFAEWSGDRNPLHVDAVAARRTYFGRRIAHGMLTVSRALQTAAVPWCRTLDVEFRGAVAPETDYSIDAQVSGDHYMVSVIGEGNPALIIRGTNVPAAEPDASGMTADASASAPARRAAPADRSIDEFNAPLAISGAYETGPVPESSRASREPGPGTGVGDVHLRALALCSYIVGMELPGLRSLFTRATLTFDDDPTDSPILFYRARRSSFDPQFRMLDTRIDIVRPDGRPVAWGNLRSYVRFTPIAVDPDAMAERITDADRRLAGKVALITGGTRGLGADLTTALAAAGCHVYASYHDDDAGADALAASLDAHGLRPVIVKGDAGDLAWCDGVVRDIQARHGRLDVLVLNACAPPSPLTVDRSTAAARDAYVAANLRLSSVPLAACLPSLHVSGGSVVCISSSFVDEAPAGFAHYVGVKQAVETLVREAVRESPGLSGVIARPPRLQTAWNDTPTGVLGTIPADWAASTIVHAIAAATAGTSALVTDFPSCQRTRRRAAAPDLVLGIAASFTAEPLLPGLRFWFDVLGITGDVQLAPYGQIVQTLLTGWHEPTRHGKRVNVVLLRVRDWLRELSAEHAGSPEYVRAHLESAAQDFVRALRTHRAQAVAETIVLICPSSAGPKTRPATDPDATTHSATSEGWEDDVLARTEAGIVAALGDLPGVQVVVAGDLHDRYGVADADIADPLREHIAHVPYQDAYFHVLATIAIRHAHRGLVPPRKVVVVDCDNTLWRGVVGEVGDQGIVFDEAHRQLHATLIRLAGAGMLVCLCSKNEEADVWRVFETRTDWALRRDHIVASTINWQPKSANIIALAERLNLGLDSFIFLDDNPVECAEVRSAAPEVLTVQWPQESDRARRLLDHLWELDGGAATAEDARRTQLYREEFKRQALAETLTFRDFLASLDLRVELSPLTPADLARASQLTLRTNQFNFTTRRRDEAELSALAADGRHEIRTVRVTDRFGDYGLVGLLIAELAGDTLVADTFLLSCRVLGRGVEHHMAAELGRLAIAHGARDVRVEVIPTARNTPARQFVESIVPEASRQRSDNGSVRAVIPAEWLSQMRFEPPERAPEPVADEKAPAPRAALSTDRVRRREEQIARAAFELDAIAGLARAIDPASAAAPRLEPGVDVAATVVGAFASALRLPAADIQRIDRLDALGCDSFRIVEITVALTRHFPWLPGTLLFEHRSISEIVRHIAELSSAAPAAHTASSKTADVLPAKVDSGDIAIIGLQVRTAGAKSADELWDLLSRGAVAVRPVPVNRPYFLHPLRDTRPHWAGLLDDVDRFDAELFGISPREAELMDPQLRLFLEVAWDALEDAGAAGADLDPDTGVFAGVMYGDYAYRANLASMEAGSPYKCWEGFSLANRLSQIFGLRGPSLAIDTACSSSGTAIHLACRALNAGDCRVALVGGVNLILDPDRFAQLGRLGILSATGRCLAFGAEADGTVLGEGAGAIVLRRLEDALAHGDRIYGIIKGTGLSTGSGTVGFTAPNPQAQADAIRRALQAARIDPRTVSYVETHGTGTSLGDPIELRGLALAYGDRSLWDARVDGAQRCGIGSIKPNIGHLEAGAGIIGLIKVLLQFQHRQLVPSVTSAAPNPQIPFQELPFAIQRALEPWNPPVLQRDGAPAPVPLRAAVSSFGVGGSNAHVILEAPPPSAQRPAEAGQGVALVTLSARSADALAERAAALREFLDRHPDAAIGDIAASSGAGRRHFEHRAAIAAADSTQLAESFARLAAGAPDEATATGLVPRASAPPRIAFLFTGQGAQYAGMGRVLYDAEPVFRRALDDCAAVFDRLLAKPLLLLLFAREGTPEAELLNQTGYTQPALVSFELALAALWRSWGIEPDVVLGHSVGEIAAMCAAGGLTLEDALTLIAARGRLMQALPAGGAMVSVMADEERVRRAIDGAEDRVAIAAVNGPRHVVISGDGSSVSAIAAAFQADGVKTKSLTVSHAFHSPLMRPMVDEYSAIVRNLTFRTPSTPFVGAVTGALANAAAARPEYWIRNVSDPVRFLQGMQALREAGATAFIEIGPQPVLLGMGRQCVDDERLLWLPSLRRNDSSAATYISSLARLYVAGGAVDWRRRGAGTRLSLPGFPFARKRHWIQVPTAPSESMARVEPTDSRRTDLHIYDVAWQEQPRIAAAAPDRPRGAWIVVSEAPAAAALCRALGPDARVVLPNTDGALERALDRMDGQAGGVLFVPSLPTSGAVPSAARTAVLQALGILQTLARRPSATPLWIVTRGAVAVRGDEETDESGVAAAALWGLARTAALEMPDRWGGIIDVDDWDDADAVAHVAAELQSGGDDDQVALRRTVRFVPRLARRADADTGGLPSIDPTKRYLITGGTGALGRHTAEWLVSAGARHLVLVSRSGPAAPGAAEIQRTLEQAGARVAIVAADLAREDDVRRVVAEFRDGGAPPGGIVHGAGIDATIPLTELDARSVEPVLAAKIDAAWLLHRHTQDLPLDFFVSYSSIAGVLGSAGRAAYAAANAALDALASHQRAQGLAGLSVAWGPWKGDGMAAGSTLEQFERMGNHGLDPHAALAALEQVLAAERPTAMIAAIDWDAFLPVYEARRPRPIVSTMRGAASTVEPEKVEPSAPWIAALAAVTEADRVQELTARLRVEAARTLGFEQAEDLRLDQSLFDSGMDSLVAAEFAQRLRKQLGIHRSGIVFDHPYLPDLAARLLEELTIPATVEALVGSGAGSIARVDPTFRSGVTTAPPRGPTFRSGVSAPSDAPPTSQERPPEVTQTHVVTRFGPGDDLARLQQFQREAWPRRRTDWLLPRWRWMFVDSAARLGIEPCVWLCRDGDAIVGHNGAIPVMLQIGAQSRPASWLVDTMVLEAYRSQAVGARLMAAAHDDLPFALSLGQTAQMRAIQLRLGWHQVAPLATAQLLINPERVLDGKLPVPAARAASWGLRASSAVRGAFRQRPSGTLREVARFGPEHDALWIETAASVGCAVRRDASYLNWKYVDQPGQNFIRLELVEDGRVRGVAICMIREPDDNYRYRRGFVVDVVAPLSETRRLERLVEMAACACGDRGADAVVCLHIDARLTRALRRSGFHLRAPERFLLVRPEGLDDDTRRRVLSPDNWFVTQGDSDIDRPW